MTLKPEKNSRITVENGMHIILCIAILAAFALYAVLPVYSEYQELKSSVCQMKCEQTEYVVLLPFYAELNSSLNQTELDAIKAVEVEFLDKEKFATMHTLIQGMAEKCGLNLLKATPHVYAVSAEKRFLGLKISAEGEFNKMRPFIQAVMQMPSFFHLEQLKISKYEEREQLELQIWLSVN